MYRIDKATNDIVITGFEQGIAPSPHKGLANVQNANISTETGEAMASFARAQQSMTSTATSTGSLTFVDSSHVSLAIAGSNNLFKGQWITVTSSSHTGELPNGTYYVPPSTGSNFQLANYYNAANFYAPVVVTTLVVAGGGGSGSASNGGSGAGGGGQVVPATATMLLSGSYTVNIGTGGAGGVSNANGNVGVNSFLIGNNISSTAFGGLGGISDNAGAPNGGASGSGKAGGVGFVNGSTANAGGGGGGDSVVGSGASSANGGNGGTGTSSSISGASVSYGGGGGGGGSSTAGTGTGGGGNGAVSGVGTVGTANTGGGGGGSRTSGGSLAGAAGGSGIVIISIPTSAGVTATGGTHTVSGGNDIWTFTSSGTWTPTMTITTVPSLVTGFTAGLTATIQLVRNMGLPLASATETYYRAGTKYNRYYILDNQNLVWVYDTFNETLYSSSDNVNWFLPDYRTDWCTSATGIAVISGFLVAAAKTGLYGKPTDLLGNTNATTTTWTQFNLIIGWEGGATNSPHFAFTGHQGRMYITDGNYISEVFPESTLANTSASSQNIQSFSSWTVSSGNVPYEGIYSVIDGSSPVASDGKRVPAVFFTNSAGHLPFSMVVGTVYYISASTTGLFNVFLDPTVPATSTVTFTGSLSSGATSATLSSPNPWPYATGTYTLLFSNGDSRTVTFTKNSTSVVWLIPLSSSATANAGFIGYMDIQTGAFGTQYFDTFYPIASASGYLGATPTFLWTPQRLTLPSFEIAQCIAEIGNQVLVGCLGSVVYPWDQVQNLPQGVINLPESNVASILTVNQMGYIFVGNKANIYVTDGNQASQVISVPDYAAGVPGSPATYVEPQFTWGGTGYIRGRIYFSIQDQTATKAGNCGGVWSFIPTQNLYIGQDTGIALRLENKNSYNSYNGMAPVLIPRMTQVSGPPLYWSAWQSDQAGTSYGIDYSTLGTNASFTTIIETDAIPTGTMLDKQTFKQIEYKLSSPLDLLATLIINYRKDLTSAWKSCGTVNIQGNRLSGYFPANFEKTQWLQLQVIITPITSTAVTNSFVRLAELRIR